MHKEIEIWNNSRRTDEEVQRASDEYRLTVTKDDVYKNAISKNMLGQSKHCLNKDISKLDFKVGIRGKAIKTLLKQGHTREQNRHSEL